MTLALNNPTQVGLVYLTAYQLLIGYLKPTFDTNDLYTLMWFQVFLSNINNSYTIIWFLVII